MKPLRLMLVAVSISLICIPWCSLVSALGADEVSVSLYWSSPALYQGDMATARITLKSNCADRLLIYYIGVHFDWMPADSFYGLDLSDNPVLIPASGSYIFDPMSIQIPANVSIGAHSYFVGIDGVQGSSSNFSWDSPTSTIQIRPINEKYYAMMMSQILKELNESINAKYESAEARSLLTQAQYEYTQAQSLANAGNWQEALPHLYNASDLLDQARKIEQLSDEQKAGPQNLLFYGAIIAVVAIVAVSIIVIVLRRKRKLPEPEAEQPAEAIEEPSEEQG